MKWCDQCSSEYPAAEAECPDCKGIPVYEPAKKGTKPKTKPK